MSLASAAGFWGGRGGGVLSLRSLIILLHHALFSLTKMSVSFGGFFPLFLWVGEWAEWEIGIKEGTCCDKHQVPYVSDESQNPTRETNIMLYVT